MPVRSLTTSKGTIVQVSVTKVNCNLYKLSPYGVVLDRRKTFLNNCFCKLDISMSSLLYAYIAQVLVLRLYMYMKQVSQYIGGTVVVEQ